MFSRHMIALFCALSPMARSGLAQEPEKECPLTFVEAKTEFAASKVKISSGCLVSNDGRHVYASRTKEDRLFVYARDEASGKLKAVQDLEISRPAALAMSPDDRTVYVVGQLFTGLYVCGRNVESGVLEVRQSLAIKPSLPPRPLSGIVQIAVSPDGRNLYAVNRSWGGLLLVFARNGENGDIELRQSFQDDNASDVAPGTNVRYSDPLPNAILADGLRSVEELAISPDGDYVYTAGCGEHAVGVFARDRDTGLLEFVDAFRGPKLGTYGLNLVSDVEVSPDGLNLYAATVAGCVVAFKRDSKAGTLEWLQAFRSSEGDNSGIDYAEAVAVTPDGRDVLVAASGAVPKGSGIARFRRDKETGKLTWVGTIIDGECGCTTLRGSRWLAVSPDGRHVYNTSAEHTVGVFAISEDD